MNYDYDERLNHLISEALTEDVGDGDQSTLCCIPSSQKGYALLKIKEEGILAGIDVAKRIFLHTDPEAEFKPYMTDGSPMKKGDVAFEIHASVRALLESERLVLNCMQRMSGIATLTRNYTDKIKHYHTRLLDTRKTTPNFRLLEKEAVRIGGGTNHRFGLFDMILLKDNHIDFCGGIEKAITLAHDYVLEKNPELKIEIETRSMEDVKIAIKAGRGKISRIMLDNFSPEKVKEAVKLIDGEFETEASGGIRIDTIEAYAKSGVDFVSAGGIIHQARSLDLSLKAEIQ